MPKPTDSPVWGGDRSRVPKFLLWSTSLRRLMRLWKTIGPMYIFRRLYHEVGLVALLCYFVACMHSDFQLSPNCGVWPPYIWGMMRAVLASLRILRLKEASCEEMHGIFRNSIWPGPGGTRAASQRGPRCCAHSWSGPCFCGKAMSPWCNSRQHCSALNCWRERG